jgi:hypothetical protein
MSKQRRFDMRLSEDEFERLGKCAKLFGKSKTAYIKALISLPVAITTGEGQMRDPAYVVVFDRKTQYEIGKQLRYWGRHFNDGVHALNRVAASGYLFPEDADRHVAEGMKHLRLIRAAKVDIEDRLDEVDGKMLIAV